MSWGKGSWGKASWGQAPWGATGSWGAAYVPGLDQAWMEALEPIASEEPNLGQVLKQFQVKVQKVIDKYKVDERAKEKLTSTASKAFIEEFVEFIMAALFNICYEKEWFGKVCFTQPLLIIVLHTFQEGKIFSRTLKPQIVNYIEDGVFKWSEDQRVEHQMTEAIGASGIKDEYKKKALGYLQKSYDDAYFGAPYGTSKADRGELAVLQDFVKGWLQGFIQRSHDVLENGLPDTSKDVQVATVAMLFQTLMDPNIACMPAEIATQVTSAVGGLPGAPWEYVFEATNVVFMEQEMANQKAPKRFKGAGK